MHVVDIVILAGWAAFWIYWFAAAAGAKPGQNRSGLFSRGFVGLRVGIILVVLLLFRFRVFKGHQRLIMGPMVGGRRPSPFLPGPRPGYLARLYLGRNWGMPMSKKEDPELVTTGRYRKHPPPDLLGYHPGDDRYDASGQRVLVGGGSTAGRLLYRQRLCGGADHGQGSFPTRTLRTSGRPRCWSPSSFRSSS